MVLKSIGSGITRIRIEKNHKHVRVDATSDRKRTEQAIKRAENHKRYLPKVVRRVGRVGETPQVFVGEGDMATQ